MLNLRMKTAIAAAATAVVASAIAGTAIATQQDAPHKAIQDRNGPDLLQPAPGQEQPKSPHPAPPAGPTGPVSGQNDNQIMEPSQLGGVPMPFGTDTISLNNVYMGAGDGDYVDLYAGAPTDSPSDGLLIVQVTDPAGSAPAFASGQHSLPGTGALSLISVDHEIVTLVDAHGDHHRFNLASERFS